MRWLALFSLFFSALSYGASINQPEAIAEAIVDTDNFSFFYVGHAYGAHNGGGGTNKRVYPHPELIRNIDNFKNYDFGVFGGDVVEICTKQSIAAFESNLLQPIGVPVINSMGNHDKCMQDHYGFPTMQSFTKKNNTFLVINSNQQTLTKDQVTWLATQIDIFNTQPDSKRLFIFTHRPLFMLLDTPLRNAAYYANFPIQKDDVFTQRISTALADIKSGKSVFWLSGDFGMRLPYAYSKFSNSVTLIATGLYERNDDHYLDIRVTNNEVKIQRINLLSGKPQPLYGYASTEYQNNSLPKNAFDEGWTESMLAKLYTSAGIDKGQPISATSIKNSENKKFNFYYIKSLNSILLKNKHCGAEGDNLFFVQYHPLNISDRRIRKREWNGYHFYASRLTDGSNRCMATIPLPEYPIKYIRTGQLTKERDLFWLAEVPPPK